MLSERERESKYGEKEQDGHRATAEEEASDREAPSSVFKVVFLCFSFFVFLLFLSNHHGFFTSSTFRPPLTASTLSLLYSSASHSILDPPRPTTATTSFTLQHRILLPDHYLLILTNHQKNQFHPPHELECVYYTLLPNGSSSASPEPVLDVEVQPVLSTDRYDESRSIARASGTTRTRLEGFGSRLSHLSGNVRHPVRALVPSVARVGSPGGARIQRKNRNKYELCVCTMVWNQASALREWVMYHAWLGVERWFIYDNNSDDDIEQVIQDLDLQGYNVSRQAWPWIKTQEAGFSHCALRAREECRWVGFFDVDEFFYFPNEFHHQMGQGVPGENSLRSVVANYSSSKSIAEIRTACHSFGPSGLNSPPKQGVTVGYTCRLQSPERHKSIVRPDLLDTTLLNVVHHFQLREGYRYSNMPEGTAIINHYKYQVWETFKAKFFRRVATYVVDWQEDQNKGSKDRAPGLGTEAIEPPNWRLQFCEVWDTGLKDFLLSYFADPATGLMPWERSFL
ncbi:Glycosyltransferase family 92 [Sesbania bispinosa]|nr:Glycosyltransferase family 92 [Sesbania bispinosa]